jgi:hypothetical protein
MVMVRSITLRLLGAYALCVCVVAPAHAQVDIQAIGAYLRTGINSGSEVTTPALGQEVYVHVDYKVIGGTAPFNAVVRALIDGVEHCSGSLEFMPDSDQAIWCPVPVVAAAGGHTLRWELDSQNQVNESNEGNNNAEFAFTTAGPGSRDLEALRAYLATEPNGATEVTDPNVGQQIYVHFEYRVGGSGDEFTASVAATLDGEPYCDGPIEFTPGIDGVVWCPTAVTATAGTHTLEWAIDSESAITETDETNNLAALTFTVGGTPGLCVGDCDESDSVVVNELVTGVNIALDRADIEDCRAFDRDDSGTVQVNELVSGVDNLLRGCR